MAYNGWRIRLEGARPSSDHIKSFLAYIIVSFLAFSASGWNKETRLWKEEKICRILHQTRTKLLHKRKGTVVKSADVKVGAITSNRFDIIDSITCGLFIWLVLYVVRIFRFYTMATTGKTPRETMNHPQVAVLPL